MSLFLNDSATTKIYTLSLHDALPIYRRVQQVRRHGDHRRRRGPADPVQPRRPGHLRQVGLPMPKMLKFGDNARRSLESGVEDRKSTRLNSSHANTSYAVFCLKKKYAC